MKFHNRAVYTFLDALGDIGGLFDALRGVSYYIVLLFFKIFGEPMHAYLLNSVFMKNPKDKDSKESG